MLKPKNISIKKLTEPQPPNQPPKKHTTSRKSLKMPKKQPHPSNQPSPIHIMKQDTNMDTQPEQQRSQSHQYQYQQPQPQHEHDMDMDSSEPDHGNFIKYINGYLNQLDHQRGDLRRNSEKGKDRDKDKDKEIQAIRRKIMKEKEINRNMQRNIVQFQRILLQRTEKLDVLEDCMRRLQAKQNNRNASNLSHHHPSHAKSRNKITKHHFQLQQISSEFEHQPSEYSESDIAQDKYRKYQQRRKTELPTEIQRMISRTMALKPDKFNRKY